MWPFKSKPKHIGPKTVDWQPGDMAECMETSLGWDVPGYGPDKGDKLFVSDVRYGKHSFSNTQTFYLSFIGYGKSGFESRVFRKITLTETGADRKVGKRKPVTVQS